MPYHPSVRKYRQQKMQKNVIAIAAITYMQATALTVRTQDQNQLVKKDLLRYFSTVVKTN